MDKEVIINNIVKAAWFTVAIIVIIWVYYSNLRYNQEYGIDAFTSATQIYNEQQINL